MHTRTMQAILTAAVLAGLAITLHAQEEPIDNENAVKPLPNKIELAAPSEPITLHNQEVYYYRVQCYSNTTAVPWVYKNEAIDRPMIKMTLAQERQTLAAMPAMLTCTNPVQYQLLGKQAKLKWGAYYLKNLYTGE